ncbi:MAG TPA: hypothetical protein VEX86_24145 [Longimicrobium sp.]|nr:hypothetical protein [Longimicrobium sp.]
MNVYLFSLLLGFVGLLVMAVSGVAGGHGGHSHGGGHDTGGHLGHDMGDVSVHGMGGGHVDAGHLHAGDAGGAHGDAAHGHGDHGHGDQGHGAAKAVGSWFLSFLSPRALFSVLVGVGAAGLLLAAFLSGPLLLAAAIVGGLLFEMFAVRPVWNFFFRFGSEPALTLESAITDTATAVTSFNRDGEGLVKIELDGQIVQVLARLAPADRESGVRVRSGDSLVVEEVDPVRNSCVVSLPVSAGLIRGA